MRKNKKLAITLATVATLVVVTVGGTFAYFTANTGSKTNTFTMGNGITGETDEPNWKEEEAKNFVPGKVIAKDPVIKNLSKEGTDAAWVAAKITYQVKSGDEWVDTTYANLDKFINIQTNGAAGFNTAAWTMDDDNTTAYLNATLAAQVTSAPIFTAVEIDPLALTPEQVTSATGSNVQFDVSKYEAVDAEGKTVYTYTTYQMQDFQILVQGYMVQEAGFDNAQAAMTEAFPTVFPAKEAL